MRLGSPQAAHGGGRRRTTHFFCVMPSASEQTRLSAVGQEVGGAMGLGALCLILAAIFVWGMFSARAAAISTPIFFVATGVVMSQGLKLLSSSRILT